MIKIKKGNKVIAIFEIVERPKVLITIEKKVLNASLLRELSLVGS